MSLDAPQMIYQVQKLRDMGQDGKHARRTEVHDTIGDLLHKMEKERLQFQETLMQTKQREREARDRQRQLEQALIDVVESSKTSWVEAEKREREHEEKIKVASKTLSMIFAEIDEAQKRVQQLEGDFVRAQQKVGNSDVRVNQLEQRAVAILNSFEPAQTERRPSANWGWKSTSRDPAVSSEDVRLQLREVFGEQAHRLRNALTGHHGFASGVKHEVQKVLHATLELAGRLEEQTGIAARAKGSRMGRGKSKGEKGDGSSLSPVCSVSDLLDGWKEARPCNGAMPFWYNERTRAVSFSSPGERESAVGDISPMLQQLQNTDAGGDTVQSHYSNAGYSPTLTAANDPNTMTEGDALTTQTEATLCLTTGNAMLRDKLRNDSISCNGEYIPARRASFGRHLSICGQACVADPFMADTELRNLDRMRGRIAIIGRGVTQFTEKAQIAANAGAIGVIFVNTKRRLFDAIGHADGINIPVVTVSICAREKLKDGADISFNLDSLARLGSAAELERRSLAARMTGEGRQGIYASMIPPLVAKGEPISPVTAAVGCQTPGRSSMYSQEVTDRHSQDDHMSIDRFSDRYSVASGRTGTTRPSPPLLPWREVDAARGEGTPGDIQGITSVQNRVHQQQLTQVGSQRRDQRVPPKFGLLQGVDVPSRVSADATTENKRDVAPQPDDMVMASRTETKSTPKAEPIDRRRKKTFSKLKVSLYRKACEKVGVVPLPPGWNMRISRTHGEVLYYCTGTGERRWSPPPLETVSNSVPGSARSNTLSPISQMLSPGRPNSALSNLTKQQQVGDDVSVMGAGSQANPRSPALYSLKTDDRDDFSEMTALGSTPLAPLKIAEGDIGMVIPPWPDDLVHSISTMARILVGGKQIVCTRAAFGLQADPAWANMVVHGKVVRSEPWQAERDIENADEVKGSIALIGRGGCPFTEKARRAQKCGAIAVVIVNFSDNLFNVLGELSDFNLPVVSIAKRDADTLLDGTFIAVQWGEGLAPVVTASEVDSKPWTFKMTSQVGFDAGAAAHLPVIG